MNVTIDRAECISCGACYGECPEFFEENTEDNWSQVVAAYRTNGDPAKGTAPAELEACVTRAADACPVTIIHIA